RVRALLWLGLASFGLAQVATAHLTNGLLMASIVLVLYLVATVARQVRMAERGLWTSTWRAVLLLLPFPLLAAAVLLPRLAYLPRTSIGHGYAELATVASRLSGHTVRAPLAAHGRSVWWATAFAKGPTAYAGVLAVVLVVAAFTVRRWRFPAAAFALVGLIGYVLNLDLVIRAKPIRTFALKTGLGELWLRDPTRFRYLLLIAFAGLAGYGLRAWIDRGPARSASALLGRALWLLPPLVVFVALPAIGGSPARSYLLLSIALIPAVALLLLVSAERPVGATALPLVALCLLVAVELTTAGLLDQLPPSGVLAAAPGRLAPAFGRLRPPSIDPAEYMTAGPLGRRLIESKS